MNDQQLEPVTQALAEDIGAGDLTCEFFVPADQQGTARIVARQGCVVAGSGTAAEVFAKVDPALKIELLAKDGARVAPGAAVVVVRGAVRSILAAERVALNFLQQLSGVATLTRKFVEQVGGTGAAILDTRKTTPGLRALEKTAVKAGGGTNHRFGLFDMVMVKDNHLAAKDDLPSLQESIRQLKRAHPSVKIELEADTVEQVRGFLTLDGVDVILLDNMTLDQLRACVALAGGTVKLEASGGVSLDRVRAIAETGVDFISVGALTHSAPAADFSLELERNNGRD